MARGLATLVAVALIGTAASQVDASELAPVRVFGQRKSGGALAHGASAMRGRHAVEQPMDLGSAVTPQVAARTTRTTRTTPAASQGRATTASSAQPVRAIRPTARTRYSLVVPTIEGELPIMTTQRPGLLLLGLDTSRSMRHTFGTQVGVAKADALADAGDEVIGDWVDNLSRRGRIEDALDVGVVRYSADGVKQGLVNHPGLPRSITAIGAKPLALRETRDGEGQVTQHGVWFEPEFSALRTPQGTPMRAGMRQLALQYQQGWQRRPSDRSPHLVLAVHVTDGQSTDGSPAGEVDQLAQWVTAGGGSLLMTNIHLASGPGRPIVFPDDSDYARLDQHGRLLFQLSSLVPPALAAELGTRPGARMMAYNASISDFAKVFRAGSSVAW